METVYMFCKKGFICMENCSQNGWEILVREFIANTKGDEAFLKILKAFLKITDHTVNRLILWALTAPSNLFLTILMTVISKIKQELLKYYLLNNFYNNWIELLRWLRIN